MKYIILLQYLLDLSVYYFLSPEHMPKGLEIKREEWKIQKKLTYETRIGDYLYIKLGKDVKYYIYQFLFSK